MLILNFGYTQICCKSAKCKSAKCCKSTIHDQKIVPEWNRETLNGKNDQLCTFTQLNIALKRTLVFRAFEGNKDGFTNL